MTEAWKQYAADFNGMSDAEIQEETDRAQREVDEHENWLEAVASWEAAGKPRRRTGARMTPPEAAPMREDEWHRGYRIEKSFINGYDFQHSAFDPENPTDWRHGTGKTVQDCKDEIDALLADDAEWTAATDTIKRAAMREDVTQALIDAITKEVNGPPGSADNRRNLLRRALELLSHTARHAPLVEWTEDEVRASVKASIDAPGNSHNVFARTHGLSSAKLSEFLSGKRGAEPSIIKPMGYRWALVNANDYPRQEGLPDAGDEVEREELMARLKAAASPVSPVLGVWQVRALCAEALAAMRGGVDRGMVERECDAVRELCAGTLDDLADAEDKALQDYDEPSDRARCAVIAAEFRRAAKLVRARPINGRELAAAALSRNGGAGR